MASSVPSSASTTPSVPAPADALTRQLVRPLRDALAQFSDLIADPDTLAKRLALVLGPHLADAGFAAAVEPVRPVASPADTAPPAVLVLRVIAEHPAGRRHGLTPDALAMLTQLPLALLARTISKLVQDGELVRDAWLVRLPEPDDLLGPDRGAGVRVMTEGEPTRSGQERRLARDRRGSGERRLYERREAEQ